jgi:hypothetical protein
VLLIDNKSPGNVNIPLPIGVLLLGVGALGNANIFSLTNSFDCIYAK